MANLLVTAMVLGAAGMAMAWPPWKHHMSVNIINEVGENGVGGMPISVHCKSHDDDLGQQTVLPHQMYGFGFYPNVISTTLYWCRFQWGTRWQSFTVWQDIGPWARRTKLCNQCVYVVRGAEGFWRSEGPVGPYSKICEWK